MCPSVLDSISSCIGSASTEITSLIAPTCILKFKVAVSVILTRTCSMVAVLNPLRVASTLYEPGGSNGTMYRPSPCVAVVLTCPVAVFVTLTLTPGSTLPLGSLAVPPSAPVCAVCP